MLEGCVVHAQWWCPDGCGLAPLETSLPGFPLFDGPNPLGAIRSSNSSIWTSWISSFIFVSPFLPFLDSPQKLKPKTESRNHFRFPQFRLSFYPPAGPSGIAPLGTALWSLLLLGLEGLLCSAPTVEGAIRFSNSSTFI